MAASLLNRVVIPLGSLNMRPEHFLAPAVFGWFVLYRLMLHRKPLAIHPYTLLALAWVGTNLLSSLLFAPSPLESLKHVVRMALLACIFMTLACYPPFRPSRWAFSLKLWLSLCQLALLYGILGWLLVLVTGRPVFGVYWPENFPYLSVEGTLSERNLYGIVAGTTLVILLTIFFRQWWLRRAALLSWRYLAVGIVLSINALVISLTRSAWVAIGLGALLAFLTVGRRFSGRFQRFLLLLLLALPLALTLFLFLLALFPETNLVERLQSFGRLAADPTWQIRLSDARNAFRDWLSSPLFGHGTGSFAQLHGIRAGTVAWISNLILHTLVDTGLVGLAVQLALIFLLYRDAWRAAHSSPSPELQIGLPALALGLLTLFITFQLTDGTWLALFWIHLGLMANGVFTARQAAQNIPSIRLQGSGG